MTHFTHSAGGIVLNSKGEVVVVNQRNNSWSLPKGGIQAGEDPRNAAAREITEETGIINLKFIKLLKSYSRYALSNTGGEDKSKPKRITMYLFTTDELALHPMDPRIPEARWVPKEQVKDLLTHPIDQDFYEAAMPELNMLLVA